MLADTRALLRSKSLDPLGRHRSVMNPGQFNRRSYLLNGLRLTPVLHDEHQHSNSGKQAASTRRRKKKKKKSRGKTRRPSSAATRVYRCEHPRTPTKKSSVSAMDKKVKRNRKSRRPKTASKSRGHTHAFEPDAIAIAPGDQLAHSTRAMLQRLLSEQSARGLIGTAPWHSVQSHRRLDGSSTYKFREKLQ